MLLIKSFSIFSNRGRDWLQNPIQKFCSNSWAFLKCVLHDKKCNLLTDTEIPCSCSETTK